MRAILLLLTLFAALGHAGDSLGLGPAPAAATIYTGGAIPAATDVTYSDGAGQTGDTNFTRTVGTLSTGFLAVANTTPSTTSSTGAFVVTGGIGASGSGNLGNNVITAGGAGTTYSIFGQVKLGNNINSFDVGNTVPTAYGTASTGGAYPFLEAGNLVISPRVSGATRDVVISTLGTAADFKFDRTGLYTVANATASAITLGTAGGGISIKSGSNARCGTAVLTAGSSGAVANTSVTANTRVMVTVQAPGGTQGFLSTSKVNATSFTVTSTSGTETSTVAWALIENP